MKAVILAGGLGSRLSEETSARPKPMVEIGGRPILWHIMKSYSHFGVNDFIICCGYRGYMIKEYFINYYLHTSDLTIDLQKNEVSLHERRAEPWRVTLIDTGQDTMTGGRLKRVRHLVENEPAFCMTYGDGVADIDIAGTIAFHRSHGKLATLTATMPSGRFGALHLDAGYVTAFKEKPRGDGALINGGFFVLDPRVIDYIADDATTWEQEPLTRLAADRELVAYEHTGFWQPMDTLRDKHHLEEMWHRGEAPWKLWSDA